MRGTSLKFTFQLWGDVLANPVGLAAGFDKDGEAIDGSSVGLDPINTADLLFRIVQSGLWMGGNWQCYA